MRVLLIDATELVIEGLRAMLAAHRKRVELIGSFSATVPQPPTLAAADVVLLDIDQHGATGHALMSELMATSPLVPVVMLTNDADERHLFKALRLGIAGYLLKSMTGAALAEHLVRAADGEVVVDPTMASQIATWAARGGNGASWPGCELGLSRRESEVLDLLVNGRSNGQIAAELIVGPETVKTHLRSIYRKLGVNNRAQAVASALRQGVFSDGFARHPLVVSTGQIEPAADGSEEVHGERALLEA